MFALWVEFLCFILNQIETCMAQGEICHQDQLSQTFEVFQLLKRLDRTIQSFVQVLKVWQTDFYHGVSWSAAHHRLGLINSILSLLGDDLNQLIYQLNPDCDPQKGKRLRYQFRGNPGLSKTDLFDIWRRILAQNVNDKLSGWISSYSKTTGETLDTFGTVKFFPATVKRSLLIPTYSLLLPQAQRTSELTCPSQSQWKAEIEALIYGPLSPHVEWFPDLLKFLPEYPPTFPIATAEYSGLQGSDYALRVDVPEQEPQMNEMIAKIEQGASTFHRAMRSLQQILQPKLEATIIDLTF